MLSKAASAGADARATGADWDTTSATRKACFDAEDAYKAALKAAEKEGK